MALRDEGRSDTKESKAAWAGEGCSRQDGENRFGPPLAGKKTSEWPLAFASVGEMLNPLWSMAFRPCHAKCEYAPPKRRTTRKSRTL